MRAMRYEFVLVPPTPPHDVAYRELTLSPTSDSMVQFAPIVVKVSPEMTVISDVILPQDSTVMASLVDVDDAGNVSDPRIVIFKVRDTIAPPRPGEFEAVAVSEEEILEPAPASDEDPENPTEPEGPPDASASLDSPVGSESPAENL